MLQLLYTVIATHVENNGIEPSTFAFLIEGITQKLHLVFPKNCDVGAEGIEPPVRFPHEFYRLIGRPLPHAIVFIVSYACLWVFFTRPWSMGKVSLTVPYAD